MRRFGFKGLGMADRTISESDVTDSASFVGGSEADKLVLAGGGHFDFTHATLSGYDTIVGSSSYDDITISSDQLAGIKVLDGGEGGKDDSLFLVGSSIDLRNIAVLNFDSIQLDKPHAVLLTNDIAVGLKTTISYGALDTTLDMNGVNLTDGQIATIHSHGISTVIYGNNLASTNAPPTVTGLDETVRTVNPGDSVLIDAGGDAQVSDDGGFIASLDVVVDSINTISVNNRIDLLQNGRFSFTRSPYNSGLHNDFDFYIDNVHVGILDRDPFPDGGLHFSFDDGLPLSTVNDILHSLVFKSILTQSPAYIDVTLEDAGHQQTKKVIVIQNVGPPTTGLGSIPKSLKIVGTKGKDKLVGDIYDETLSGGAGSDILSGGKGHDTFRFDSALDKKKNVDTILDFQPHEDTIQLSRTIFKTAGKAGLLKKSAFWNGANGAAHDKDDRIIYDKKTGALYYDKDGSGSSPAIKFAEVQKKLALTYHDIVIA